MTPNKSDDAALAVKSAIYAYLATPLWYSEFPHRLEKLCADTAAMIVDLPHPVNTQMHEALKHACERLQLFLDTHGDFGEWFETQADIDDWQAAWQTSAAAHGVSHGAAELKDPQKANVVFKNDARSCTCHPSERPEPCQRKYALTDCSALQTITDCIKGAEQNGIAEYEDHECYISLAELRTIKAAFTPPAEKQNTDGHENLAKRNEEILETPQSSDGDCNMPRVHQQAEKPAVDIEAIKREIMEKMGWDFKNDIKILNAIEITIDHLHASGNLKSKEGE